MLRKDAKKEPTKKLLTFKKNDLINGFYKDKAILEDTSYSAAVESVLIKEIMTGNKVNDEYIESIYRQGVKETLANIYSNLAAGINGRATHNDAYELVWLSMRMVSHPFSNGIDPVYAYLYESHFPSNCYQVAEKLKYETGKKELEFDESLQLRDNLLLLENSTKDGVDFVPYNYFNLVITHWEYLNDFTYTYRMLYDVVALSDEMLWESPKNRIDTIECLKKVTANWKTY